MKNGYIALKTRNGDTVFAGLFSSHGACLEAAVRQNISLDYIDISGLVLRNCTLDGASLRHADLRGSDLTASNLSECDMRHALLDNACLIDTCLTDTQLDHASLRHVQLLDAIMYRVSLYQATLKIQTALQIPWADITPNWPVYLEMEGQKNTPYGCVTASAYWYNIMNLIRKSN